MEGQASVYTNYRKTCVQGELIENFYFYYSVWLALNIIKNSAVLKLFLGYFKVQYF